MRLQHGLAHQRPAVKVDEMDVEDANHPWTPRERTLIKKMEGYLKQSEKLQVGIHELEYHLMSPEDGKVDITSIAETARYEGGYSRFMVIDSRRGTEVSDAARFVEQARKSKSRSKDLEEEATKRQDAIMQMEKEGSGPWTEHKS